MDYNTQRCKLALPEYGRHIHKMIEWVKQLDTKEKRNEQIHTVIAVMGNLNPHLRDINDFKHKLWDHVQVISNFDIDIDSPYPVLELESFQEKPRPIPYPSNPIRIRHYGRNTQAMVNAIVNEQDEELKMLQLEAVANHMKKAYITWNKETVTDEQIFNDIAILSKGAIVIKPEEMKLAKGCSMYNSSGGGSSGKPGQQKNIKTSTNNGKSTHTGTNGNGNGGKYQRYQRKSHQQ